MGDQASVDRSGEKRTQNAHQEIATIKCSIPSYLECLNEWSGPRLQELRIVVNAIEIIGAQVICCLGHPIEDGSRLSHVVLHSYQAHGQLQLDARRNALKTALSCVPMEIARIQSK